MLLHYLLASIGALLVAADFDIYLVMRQPPARPPWTVGIINWQFLDPNQNSCPDPAHTRLFNSHDDVSGNKIGVRCDSWGQREHNGCYAGDDNDPANIDAMEMHLSDTPKFHYTIYKADEHGPPGRTARESQSRPFELLGLKGESAGWCVPVSWPQTGRPFGVCGNYRLFRKFQCHSFYTADWINSYDRGWHP
ncbi:hypothetical protein PMIN06_011461 [Paraphaeosphaeria minitans]|uniref:Uncharacterized protein n=1 Tax=Paraphaeosphaeria minitans TaxID=565426 RepID=A0A9P6KL01_9PLEO|nr:hypothetical protein PMIN01_11199 [Paraphaeosphaeria minitans]